MDFLDPKKERRNRTVLLLGYALIALAIGIATLILWYQASGYTLDKKGKVIQNGLVFVSSQPSGAAIYLNNTRYQSNTNTRMVIPAGSYSVKISATGYRDWQRQIFVAGGDVQHYDYPFLFPRKLSTTNLASLDGDPTVATQSPDKRWLLLGETNAPDSFLEYDFKNPAKPVSSEVKLPAGSFTASEGAQAWQLVEWASDNRHVLLLHTYTTGETTTHEYILLDRDTPVDSINLTNSLKLTATETLSLYDKKVAQFYIYDQSAQTLRRVTADATAVAAQLDHILAFKSYGTDRILYVTDQPPTGKTASNQVSVVLQAGQKTITLRTLPAGATSYALNLTQYSGDWYVAVAADTDATAYVYKNPQDAVLTAKDSFPLPWRRLPVAHPTYIAFSDNAQFVLAENGQQFSVYDAENIVTYHYTAKQPLDQPQIHAAWMDGDRLMYVSGGKLVVFDYDYRNQQVLQPASAAYLPAFAPDYSYVYALQPGTADVKPALSSTALVIK